MHQQPGYWNGNKRSPVRKFGIGFPVTGEDAFPVTDSPVGSGSCDWTHSFRRTPTG
jgi:hypothetical protein